MYVLTYASRCKQKGTNYHFKVTFLVCGFAVTRKAGQAKLYASSL